MFVTEAIDEALRTLPSTVGELLEALPAGHFEVYADSTTEGRAVLGEATEPSRNWAGDSVFAVADRVNSYYVDQHTEWWLLAGVLHPRKDTKHLADPESPVALFARRTSASHLYPVAYGPEVVNLAYRVLGYGLAWHALNGERMRSKSYAEIVRAPERGDGR